MHGSRVGDMAAEEYEILPRMQLGKKQGSKGLTGQLDLGWGPGQTAAQSCQLLSAAAHRGHLGLTAPATCAAPLALPASGAPGGWGA